MKKKIAIICGGPSAERGISLNSARSVYDNLDKDKYDVSLIYFNTKLDAFSISETQIYSNTPMDFDFKLKDSEFGLTKDQLREKLQNIDLAFPAIHGLFGEDGQLQTMLESFGVKYVGSGPEACRVTSDKHLCQEVLGQHGFHRIPDWVIKKGDTLPQLPEGKYVVKPLHGGSSIGVHLFSNKEELEEALPEVFSHEHEAIIEPHIDGQEFTIIVLENGEGEAVALYPTEIEFKADTFFNYRKKYLATAETRYHTPARYNNDLSEKIRTLAEQAFKAVGMRDFARMDGWILKDGTIWFSDLNSISGMEQNSFLFQAGALIGLSHRQLLNYIVEKNIEAPSEEEENREAIPVLFGGNTAERQISVMSGTNVWMKLKNSKKYKPVPFFYSLEQRIYRVPQFLCLHHTVEEIEEKITLFSQPGFFQELVRKQQDVFAKLNISSENLEEQLFMPEEEKFEDISKKYSFLFLGLHGGAGENGTIQKQLEGLGIAYNGPGPLSSRLCMDKYETGMVIQSANIPGVTTAKKTVADLTRKSDDIWKELEKENFKTPLILKPRGDGCSAGVIRINTQDQFYKAVEFFHSGRACIPEKAIHDNHGQIDLPSGEMNELLVEEFIITDKVVLKDLEISWQPMTDLVEVTVGVFGTKGNLHVMNPSQTIASQEVLSLEEKFMGGTGVNLTPPPEPFVSKQAIDIARKSIKLVAEALSIEGYSRIDTFMNTKTGELIIIEANTLPGLTPSTVFYHQALAEPIPMTPREILEKIIEFGKKRSK